MIGSSPKLRIIDYLIERDRTIVCRLELRGLTSTARSRKDRRKSLGSALAHLERDGIVTRRGEFFSVIVVDLDRLDEARTDEAARLAFEAERVAGNEVAVSST